jgi:hypothetical protein
VNARPDTLGSSAAVDEARDAAAAVFGQIFKPYRNDYYGDYWLGHLHVPEGESEWRADEVKVCENIHIDEDGTQPMEPDYPDSPTLLFLIVSTSSIEDELQARGFTLLRISEV